MRRYEGETLSCRICQCKDWTDFVLSLAVTVVLGTLMIISASDVVVAAEKENSQIEDFVMGEVTGKRDKVIQIDSKDYSFLADVIVKDQNLTPRDLKDVVPGTQVMFHLKQGRIDQIIILLPS